ncbi:hypothetical protein GDO81_021640 [Engystomops pustulosus]|uniref:Taste receptor type 2 n=1 Tax=Engystomops pustulosus TaxID=76066 RepID=A0AAV6YV21_ENGPU|nr:hypothetical protein GDO81_021640 [Engystomops pustulosus]
MGLLVPGLMALIAGLVIHSFIIGVNVSDWWRGRSVTPVDLIVTSLGISRIGANALFYVVQFLLSYFDINLTIVIIEMLYDFFISANTWLTSLLSIVLCLKISNLHTRLFLYLRRMILPRTGCLIAASVILSALDVLLTLWIAFTKVTIGGTHNITMDDVAIDCTNTNSLYHHVTANFISLIFYCTSSVLLFVSLYHHTTRMKMSSNLSINLETYYSAMKLVSFTFIYNTVYYIGNFLVVFFYYFYCLTPPWLYLSLDFLPVLHSSYLIYSTAKLRNQMSKVLRNLMDFLFQSKNTETMENIEVAAQ